MGPEGETSRGPWAKRGPVTKLESNKRGQMGCGAPLFRVLGGGTADEIGPGDGTENELGEERWAVYRASSMERGRTTRSHSYTNLFAGLNLRSRIRRSFQLRPSAFRLRMFPSGAGNIGP